LAFQVLAFQILALQVLALQVLALQGKHTRRAFVVYYVVND
jgi:hypothetical protein